MQMTKHEQLTALLEKCSGLGAEIRYQPEYEHFTATVWEGWDDSLKEGEALTIQREIQQKAAQYPNLVCYCFDPFSTLVYTV